MVVIHTSNENEIKITATDTTKGNSPQTLLTNRLVPEIIPAVILPINQTTVDGFVGSGRTLHAVRTVLYKDIITDATCSAAHVFKDSLVVNWKDAGRTIPR